MKVVTVLQDMVDLRQIKTGELAESSFRALFTIEPSQATAKLRELLDALPTLERNSFVAAIARDFPSIDFSGEFPFVSIGSIDGADRWLSDHPAREWPVRIERFAEQLDQFLIGHRVTGCDLSDVDRTQFRFIYRNFCQIEPISSEAFLTSNQRWFDLEQLPPIIPRKFAWHPINLAGYPRIASLSPALKNGNYIPNEALLWLFLLFSSVKIAPQLFREISALFSSPRFNAAAEAYARRMSLELSLGPNRPGPVPAFRPRVLREMCRLISTGMSPSHSIEILIATFMAEVDAIRKPHTLFLLLRLLRLGLKATGTSVHFGATIAQCTKDLFIPILNNLSTYILIEFERLLADLGEIGDESVIPAIPEDLEAMRCLPEAPEALLAGKRPSQRLAGVRALFKTSPANLRAVEPLFDRYFSIPVIAREIFNGISGCPQIVERSDVYLKHLSSPAAPALAFVSPEFLASRTEPAQFDEFVNMLPSQGYSLRNAIAFVNCWTRAQVVEAKYARRLWAKGMEMALTLFRLNASIESAGYLADTLAALGEFEDCIWLLLGKIAHTEVPFLPVLVLAHKCYGQCDEFERVRFAVHALEIEFPFDSRGRALGKIVDSRQGSIGAALAFAAAETNDQSVLDTLLNEYCIDSQAPAYRPD
jgi:hypothetical protein